VCNTEKQSQLYKDVYEIIWNYLSIYLLILLVISIKKIDKHSNNMFTYNVMFYSLAFV